MTCPSQLMTSDSCGDTWEIADVGWPLFPDGPEDLMEASLVILFQGVDVSAVVQSSTQHQRGVRTYCLIDNKHEGGFNLLIFKNVNNCTTMALIQTMGLSRLPILCVLDFFS